MKKCSSCGFKTEDDNMDFCPECGRPLNDHEKAAEETEQSAEDKVSTMKKSRHKALIAAVCSVSAFLLIAGAAVGIIALEKGRSSEDIAVSVPVSETEPETETVVFTTADIPEFQTTTVTTAAVTTTKITMSKVTTTVTEKDETDVDHLTYSNREKCFYLYDMKYYYIYTTSYFVLYNFDDSYSNPIIYAYANGRDPNSVYSLYYPDCSENDPIALGYYCAIRADNLLRDYELSTTLGSQSDCIDLSNTSYTLSDSLSGQEYENCYIVDDNRFFSEHAIYDTFCSVLNISQSNVYENYFCTENNGYYYGFIYWSDGNMYLKKGIGDYCILYYDNILKIDDYYYRDYDTIHYYCLKGNDYDCEYAGINVIEFDLVYNYDTQSWTYSGTTLNLGNSDY